MMPTHLAQQDKPSTNFSQVSKNKNYSALYKAIRAHADNPTQYSILMLVTDYVNSPENFYQSYQTIAGNVKVSRSTAKREILKMIEIGTLFVVEKRIRESSVLRLGDALITAFNMPRNQLKVVESNLPHLESDLPEGRVNLTLGVGSNLPPNVLSINDNKINDDDRAGAREIPSPSNTERTEQPVIKDRKLSSKELCDRFKQIIYLNGEPTKWIQFNLFSKVELTGEECRKIIDYAKNNHKQIQQYDLNSEDDVLNAILDMQDRMNRKPEKEYNPTQVTQVEFENNLLKKGFKIDYN